MESMMRSDEIVTLEDGYCYYWPRDFEYGCFSAEHLRKIADELDGLNKNWDEIVRKDLTISPDVVY